MWMKGREAIPLRISAVALGILILAVSGSGQETAPLAVEPLQIPLGPAYESYPAWSPKGNRIAYAASEGEGMNIYVVDIEIVEEEGKQTVKVKGKKKQLTKGDADDCRPAWSSDGKKIAFHSNRSLEGQDEIYVVDADGGEPKPTDWPGTNPCWSLDGKQIFFALWNNIFVADVDVKDKKRRSLTRGGYNDYPACSRDGKMLAFYSGTDMWLLELTTGSLPEQRTFKGWSSHAAWSPVVNGKQEIAFVSNREPEGADSKRPVRYDIWLMVPGGDLRQLTDDKYREYYPTWSPDGKWIAYAADRGAGFDLYIVPVPEGAPREP